MASQYVCTGAQKPREASSEPPEKCPGAGPCTTGRLGQQEGVRMLETGLCRAEGPGAHLFSHPSLPSVQGSGPRRREPARRPPPWSLCRPGGRSCTCPAGGQGK